MRLSEGVYASLQLEGKYKFVIVFFLHLKKIGMNHKITARSIPKIEQADSFRQDYKFNNILHQSLLYLLLTPSS